MGKVLEIKRYPDPVLREMCVPVTEFNAELIEFAEDMLKTMYHNKGVGLAAPQVGKAIRVVVADVTPDQSQPLVFVNPTIAAKSLTEVSSEEGCLSFPGQFEQVRSLDFVEVRYQDVQGNVHHMEVGKDNPLLAVCIQHEIDHLNGKLFIDRMNPKKRATIKTAMMRRR